jgi:hypothetical protein
MTFPLALILGFLLRSLNDRGGPIASGAIAAGVTLGATDFTPRWRPARSCPAACRQRSGWRLSFRGRRLSLAPPANIASLNNRPNALFESIQNGQFLRKTERGKLASTGSFPSENV